MNNPLIKYYAKKRAAVLRSTRGAIIKRDRDGNMVAYDEGSKTWRKISSMDCL